MNDNEYKKLVNDILNNDTFKKLDDIKHHGTTRMKHSIRVSYKSYKMAKKLKLNYKEAARAGLLHDFFLSKKDRTVFDRFISTFTHPKYALALATENFDLNKREKNIIRSHMFPVNFALPKYKESWLVSFADKIVATSEIFELILRLLHLKK